VSLRVQVIDGGEVARREEVVADVLDRALNAPFSLGRYGVHARGSKR
jgi:hypothetical protein